MDGIHDLGGMHGFGRVQIEPDEPLFHARWESRVLGMVYQVVGLGWTSVDAFRHAIERLPPVAYLTAGYYGRWLAALETLLVERGILRAGEVDARLAGTPIAPASPPEPPVPGTPDVVRSTAEPPRFGPGDDVRTSNPHPRGHTRLPRYARGKRGVICRVHPACVFPDTNADGRGECPQYVYSVRFDGAELWGPDAEPGTVVHLDLFESYLGPV